MIPPRVARWVNLALLVAFPIAWAAPLLRSGLVPYFGGDTVSIFGIISGLWPDEMALACLVATFAVIAPLAKIAGMAAWHWGRLPGWAKPWLGVMARLAMADVFLIALAIVLAKGMAIGYVASAWGLWLFAGCVLVSFALSLTATRQ